MRKGAVKIGSFILAIFLLGSVAHAQKIKWMTFEEALEAQSKKKKKVMVDVFTSWCTWCAKMDQSTFQNPFIVEYVNEHFYPVKFDAEQQLPIHFKGKDYEFVRRGRQSYHELAVQLTLGRLSYPTVAFLDEEMEVIQAIRGFQSALRFEQIMTYFARDFHKTVPWSTFSENYHAVSNKNH